jgi:1-deoxy-D-xylulose 5-phosphate reductoisomerase
MSLEKKKVVVLGSTGSIGRQTLDVIDKQKERFELLGIAARRIRTKMPSFTNSFTYRFNSGSNTFPLFKNCYRLSTGNL